MDHWSYAPPSQTLKWESKCCDDVDDEKVSLISSRNINKLRLSFVNLMKSCATYKEVPIGMAQKVPNEMAQKVPIGMVQKQLQRF